MSSMLDREKYIAGALVKGAAKLGKHLKKHYDDLTTEASPGQKQIESATKAQRAARSMERRGAAVTAGTGAAGAGVNSLLDEDEPKKEAAKKEKEKISYSISDLPKEGSATYESKGKTIYTNSKFKKAAQDAEGETFKYKGKTYNVEASLAALERFKKAEGGEVDSFRMMYEAFKKEMAAAKDAEEKAMIQERFQAQTQNVDEETKREVYKSMDRQPKKIRLREADGGSMLVPPEMPVDTYTPEEQANAEESQVSDEEMEDNYMNYVLDESLGSDEQDYLMNALESDPKLSEIFDKVITTASEFSGAGEVEGPGTGVSDSIPARLSDGEFVITRKATDEIGADNLQMMMDQAEREADYGGGMLRKAVGGLLGMKQEQDPTQTDKYVAEQDVTEDEINKSMLAANRMPSLQPSRLRQYGYLVVTSPKFLKTFKIGYLARNKPRRKENVDVRSIIRGATRTGSNF